MMMNRTVYSQYFYSQNVKRPSRKSTLNSLFFLHITEKKVLILVFLKKNRSLQFTLQVHARTVLLLLAVEVRHWGVSSNGILSC